MLPCHVETTSVSIAAETVAELKKLVVPTQELEAPTQDDVELKAELKDNTDVALSSLGAVTLAVKDLQEEMKGFERELKEIQREMKEAKKQTTLEWAIANVHLYPFTYFKNGSPYPEDGKALMVTILVNFRKVLGTFVDNMTLTSPNHSDRGFTFAQYLSLTSREVRSLEEAFRERVFGDCSLSDWYDACY
ncbi:hypothetical protein HDU97_004159 [Phlyctochytrium planicorne]|nr:hypothetical protein HDU97_004159 [Phlyctochytrium planicorne]